MARKFWEKWFIINKRNELVVTIQRLLWDTIGPEIQIKVKIIGNITNKLKQLQSN